MSLSLVAALGNPGRDYEATRHNLGWWVIDLLAKRRGLTWKTHASLDAAVARWEPSPGVIRWLVKPLTFMNESGRAVGAVSRYYKIPPTEVVAVYDDIGLDVGRTKISESGSAGGHNGVKSLLDHLGGGFVRYRLGIGPKVPAEMDLADFVLGNFTPEQNSLIQQKLDSFVTGLELLLDRGPAQAMNELNRRETT
jgi:PTH1 family peptidyl-tRNA hydrolase